MKMMKTKRGVFDQLTSMASGIAGLTITLVVIFLILVKVGANADVAADGNATATIDLLKSDTYSIVTWVGLIITVMIGVILLLLVRAIRNAS